MPEDPVADEFTPETVVATIPSPVTNEPSDLPTSIPIPISRKAPNSPGEQPTIVKPGPGRPRADGTVKKNDKPALMPIPSPPYKRYFSNNPNTNQQPAAALKWVGELPKWAQEKLLWYVERDWPVMLHITKEDKEEAKKRGEDIEHNYADKFGDPLENVMELQDRYGAGDYHLTVNDTTDATGNRTLCEIWVRENWRDVKAHPPTDRRIDDPAKGLNMDEKANAPYILYLRSQGKLPGQIKEQTNMAEASAVNSAMGMVNKVLDKALDDDSKRKDDTTSQVVQGVVGAMGTAFQHIQDMMPKPVDPMETVEKVVNIMDKVRPHQEAPPPPPPSGESQLLSVFMTQMFKTQEMISTIQSERVSSTERLLSKLMEERSNGSGGGGSGGGNKGGSSAGEEGEDLGTGGIGGFLKMAEMLGFKRGGGGTAAVENPGVDYKAMIPEIIDGVAKMGDVFLRGWQIKLMAEQAQRAGVPFQPPPPPPPPQQPQQQQQVQAGALPQAPAPEEEEETMQLTMFLKMIETPFLSHFHDGLGGAAFANWLIDGYKRSTYDQIKDQGPQVMKMILLQYPPIASQVKDKEKQLEKFIGEFCDEQKVNAYAAGEDEGGEGEDGEEEELVGA